MTATKTIKMWLRGEAEPCICVYHLILQWMETKDCEVYYCLCMHGWYYPNACLYNMVSSDYIYMYVLEFFCFRLSTLLLSIRVMYNISGHFLDLVIPFYPGLELKF